MAIVVTTTEDVVDADDGVVSLREAVASANAKAGADTITFADDLEGAVLAPEPRTLLITDDLTIDGSAEDAGAGSIVLQAGIEAEDVALRLEDLSLRGSPCNRGPAFGINAN